MLCDPALCCCGCAVEGALECAAARVRCAAEAVCGLWWRSISESHMACIGASLLKFCVACVAVLQAGHTCNQRRGARGQAPRVPVRP